MKRLRKALATLGLIPAVIMVLPLSACAGPNVTPRVKPTVSNPAMESSLPRPAPVVTEPRYFKSTTPYPRLAPHLNKAIVSRGAGRKPVIFIDAGHGGRDPGAIGTKGTYEKILTSKASASLKELLEKTGRYDVRMTRERDVYVDHDLRLRLAREGGADLFISIHADSAGSKNARGASVYTLADRARGRSKTLVSNSQNWIMDVDLSKQSDPVGDILVDLAQRKTESQSEQFADILLSELSGSTHLVGNSHRRAGYFVLLAPDVPAVLLELGFLSNAQDETLLLKSSHRDKMMRSVVTSIDRYFLENQ